MSNIDNRLIISIRSIEIDKTKDITFGQASDVVFRQIPEHYLSVEQTDTGYIWIVNHRYVEENNVQYVKINNENPNLEKLVADDKIHVKFAADDDAGMDVTLSYEEIKSLVGDCTTSNILLRNLLAKRQSEDSDFCRGIELNSYDNLRSFIHRDKGSSSDWAIVILDTGTEVQRSGAGEPLKFKDSGSVNGKEIKVQFFQIASYSYSADELDEESFHIGNVNYQMKPVIVTTEWGAGHVTVRSDASTGGKTAICFPKPITYVEKISTLENNAKSQNKMLTIQQNDGSFPYAPNLYLPNFSNAVRQDVCNLMVTPDSIKCEDTPVTSKFRPLPGYDVIKTNGIKLCVAVLDGWYWLSYFVPLTVVFLFVFVAYLMLTGTDGIGNATLGRRNMNRQLKTGNYRSWYVPIILLVALVYCAAKYMVAIKLSYTYPYFEKISGEIVASVCLMLSLVFNLTVALNWKFVGAERNRSRRNGFVAVLAGAVAMLLSASIMFFMTTPEGGINHDVLQSYLSSEKALPVWLNFFKWTDKFMLNDQHWTVPLTLLLVNGALVAGNLVAWVCGFNAVQKRINAAQKRIKEMFKAKADNPVFTLFSAHPTYVRIALICISILLIALLPGNFATAFVTFWVILSMPYVMSQMKFRFKYEVTLVIMSLCAVCFLIAAIIFGGDVGYMTNGIGFLAFVFIMFIYVLKDKITKTGHDFRNSRKFYSKKHPFLLSMAGFIVVTGIALWGLSFLDTEKVQFDRSTRRIEMFTQFDNYKKSGYRYADGDAEFMIIMAHNLYNTSCADPLSSDEHYLHPSVSTGQSPVVLNDVSAPAAFFGTYGWCAYVLYFGLLALLLGTVVKFSLYPRSGGGLHPMEADAAWRLLAACMWVGTTIYLYASYIDCLPFTGRLNPGLGVDAVGEALESAVLLSFMLSVSLAEPENKYNQQIRK